MISLWGGVINKQTNSFTIPTKEQADAKFDEWQKELAESKHRALMDQYQPFLDRIDLIDL